MAQMAGFEPPGPFHLNIADGHPQTRSQDLASVLKHVIIDQDGNDNPSHHTVLLLMELRANLENRHDSPDACQEPESDSVIWAIDEAMHLSLQFLQKMTDLNGNFKPLVTSCLHLATLIIHTVDTSELGDPDAVAIIKQLRKKQTTDMHRLRERWEDLLQVADDHDESATFERLSNIMDYTEDVVNDTWFDAKSFMSSCEELIRYRLDDTFLPNTYASAQTLPPPANHEAQITPRERPEPTVLHQPVAILNADTTTAHATVAHRNASQYQTPTLKTAPDRHSPTPNSETTTKPEPIPERKENTPIHNPNDAHHATAGRHLGNFSTTLTTQTRRVDDVMTEIIKRVENETLLAEVQTLATITGESAKQATRLIEGQPTLTTGPTKHEQGNAPSASEKTQNNSHTIPSSQGSTEAKQNTERHTETAPIYSMNRRDRPIFIPIDRNWYYLGARDAPSVRQAEVMQRPPGVYIGPFTGPFPIKNIANHNKDHNWRRKEGKQYRGEVAISE